MVLLPKGAKLSTGPLTQPPFKLIFQYKPKFRTRSWHNTARGQFRAQLNNKSGRVNLRPKRIEAQGIATTSRHDREDSNTSRHKNFGRDNSRPHFNVVARLLDLTKMRFYWSRNFAFMFLLLVASYRDHDIWLTIVVAS